MASNERKGSDVFQRLLAHPWDALVGLTSPTPDEKKTVASLFTRVRDLIVKSIRNVLPTDVELTGSCGKGTNLRGRNEIDVVFFHSESDSDSDDILSELNAAAKRDGFAAEHKNQYSIKLSSADQSAVHVDILPRRRLSEGWASYLSMLEEDRHYYSASSSPQQRDVIAQQPSFYKQLCRVAKLWRNQGSFADPPASCLIEMVMLHCFHEYPANASSVQAAAEIFQSFLHTLAQCDGQTFIAPCPTFPVQLARKHIVPTPGIPIIVDPVNPTNNMALPNTTNANVAETIWKELKAYAQASLDKLKPNVRLEQALKRCDQLEKDVAKLQAQLQTQQQSHNDEIRRLKQELKVQMDQLTARTLDTDARLNDIQTEMKQPLTVWASMEITLPRPEELKKPKLSSPVSYMGSSVCLRVSTEGDNWNRAFKFELCRIRDSRQFASNLAFVLYRMEKTYNNEIRKQKIGREQFRLWGLDTPMVTITGRRLRVDRDGAYVVEVSCVDLCKTDE